LSAISQATTFAFNFNYSFPLNGVPAQVTASGILTTGPFDPVAMDYTITGITGSRTEAGVTDAIASLLPPGGFDGNDNLLFPTSPFLDGNGFSYVLASGTGGNDGKGDVNVFYNSTVGAYTEASQKVGFGSFMVTPIPEPAPPIAAILAVTAFVYARRRRAG
jgi:hypothetical protein